MNGDLLRYYNEELQYLREMGGEFAAAYPKIAGRLGLDGFECADPYVERLLEGFSFLTARARMKVDAEFPRFARHLAEMVYPNYLAPTPSMIVAEFQPDWGHPSLAKGYFAPRHSVLKSNLALNGTTRCEYRTAHAMTLWPLRLSEAEYRPYMGNIGGLTPGTPGTPRRPQALLRLRFDVDGGIPVPSLDIDRLPLFLRGADALPALLYEHLVGHVLCGWATSPSQPAAWRAALDPDCIAPLGFTDEEALLPPSRQAFRGYRLLQEYFAFAERYLFVELRGLRDALRRCNGTGFDVILLLDAYESRLEQAVDPSHLRLNCVPAINLFPMRADRIPVDPGKFEYHVVPDRSRPIDFEVYGIDTVRGYAASAASPQVFAPFLRARDPHAESIAGGAFFQHRRDTRRHTERELRHGARSRYLGSDVFIALVDMQAAPFSGDLQQLGVDVLCTNRDLPLSMPVGGGATDFSWNGELPVRGIRCVAGPSEPRPGMQDGVVAWRLLNHLALNYRSLLEDRPGNGATAVRELLDLYCHEVDAVGRRQIAGVVGLTSRAVTKRLPLPGPICFGRGLELTLTLDEAAFQGGGAFLLGAVLQAFFSSYVSVNHFTETVVRGLARGEIMRWSGREGLCHTL
jgi:type VI secretion system protein ImpG